MNDLQQSYVDLFVFFESCDSQRGPMTPSQYRLMQVLSYEVYDGESWMITYSEEVWKRIGFN
jgi:hypothetical protein